MAIAHSYGAKDNMYVLSSEDMGFIPQFSTYDELPPRPWKYKWPQYSQEQHDKTGNGWILIPDYRERKVNSTQGCTEEDVQEAKKYYKKDAKYGDPSEEMKTPGDIPSDCTFTVPVQTQEEKESSAFEILRSQRDQKLSEYDKKIAQLGRNLRDATSENEEAAIRDKIKAWDAYAKALCDLPENENAPWVGAEIPWPKEPE